MNKFCFLMEFSEITAKFGHPERKTVIYETA